MSWLSTLGGAFSALGEEIVLCVSMPHDLPFCKCLRWWWWWGSNTIQSWNLIGRDCLGDL